MTTSATKGTASAALTLSLPIALTNGNEGRTKHFGASHKRRLEYYGIIRQLYRDREPFAHPVTLTVTRVLGKGERLFDADSILRGNAKEIIDALVACGFFVDDSPTYIPLVIGTQDATRRGQGPCTEITITEA